MSSGQGIVDTTSSPRTCGQGDSHGTSHSTPAIDPCAGAVEGGSQKDEQEGRRRWVEDGPQ